MRIDNYQFSTINYPLSILAARDFAGREAAEQKAILCVCRRPRCALLRQEDAGSERFCPKRNSQAEKHTMCMLTLALCTIGAKDPLPGYEKTPSDTKTEGDIFREIRPACSSAKPCCSSCGQQCSCAEDPSALPCQQRQQQP